MSNRVQDVLGIQTRQRLPGVSKLVIVVRCTSKLLDRLKVDVRTDPGTSTGLLGDWYATVVRARQQFVLAISGATLLPIVVTGRDLRSFPARVASTLAEVLAVYGVPAEVIERECAAMAEVRYARANDRSTVGVLTEFQRLLHGGTPRPQRSRTSRSGWRGPRSWREMRFQKTRPVGGSACRCSDIARESRELRHDLKRARRQDDAP